MNKFLIALLVLLVAAMAYIGYSHYLVEHPAPIAKVLKTKGVVNIRRGIDAVAGQKDVLLYEGDQLSTNKNSYTRLVMSDGTVLVMGANASLGFTEYDYNIQTSTVFAQLKSSKGAYRIVTGKVDLPRSIQVTDARGANLRFKQGDLFVGNIEGNEFNALLLSGKKSAIIANKQGKKTIAAGFGSTITSREAPLEPSLWSKDKIAAALALVFEG